MGKKSVLASCEWGTRCCSMLLLLAFVRGCVAYTIAVMNVECVYQEVEYEGDRVSGSFVVVDKDAIWGSDFKDIEMVVTSPSGTRVMDSKARGGQKFMFTATRRGSYKICFHNPTSYPESVTFSIHVGHIPTIHDVAKDEHFNPLSTKIAYLREAVESISEEQIYLKARDVRHRKTNESTRHRLVMYTLMEYVALITVSIAQVYLIQRLFSKRIGYNKV